MIKIATLVLGCVCAAHAVDAVWLEMPPLQQPRTYHGATLLHDGSVLVAGGYNRDGFAQTSEIYSPTGNAWTTLIPTHAVHDAYGGFALLTLHNGHGIAIDQNGADGSSACEEYDPRTATWTLLPGLPDARAGFVTTLLHDGDILVAGGWDDNAWDATISSCLLYHPKTMTWEYTGSMNETRANHTITLLENGKALVAGGQMSIDSSGQIFASCELYDPKSKTWSYTGSMSTARWWHQACGLDNGHVLVVGGETNNIPSSEEYDPATAAWTVRNDCTVPYGAIFTALDHGDGALRAGGVPFLFAGTYLTAVDLFDRAAHAWSSGPDLLIERSYAAAVTLPNGQVLVTGGTTTPHGPGATYLASAELFVRAPIIQAHRCAQGVVGWQFCLNTFSANGALSYQASGLPSGLTINPATGAIRGIPSAPGVATVLITAANQAGSATQTLVLTIRADDRHGAHGGH